MFSFAPPLAFPSPTKREKANGFTGSKLHGTTRRAEKAKPSSANPSSRREAALDSTFAPLARRRERLADGAALIRPMSATSADKGIEGAAVELVSGAVSASPLQTPPRPSPCQGRGRSLQHISHQFQETRFSFAQAFAFPRRAGESKRLQGFKPELVLR
jgi:hypothetical protein